MKQNEPAIFFYSNLKPLEIKTEMFDIYLQGKPSLMKDTEGTDNWIKNIINLINFKGDMLKDPLAAELKSTSGLFSLILRNENEIVLASDIIRSYPMFYGFNQDGLFITDNLEEFQKSQGQFELDNDKLEELVTSLMVYSNRTVYNSVFGLQAGEIVFIHNNEISSERYFEFKPSENQVHYKNLAEFAKIFDQILLSIFSLMVKENPNVNRWVVPLSGGHDSRLTVNYLHRLGVKNVICFSYGLPDNEQARISKQVAEALDYGWYFVEYTEQKWKTLHECGLFDDFILYAFNGVSTANLQDFLAVYELNVSKILQKGDVFIKSHGDFILGSKLTIHDLSSTTEQDAMGRIISLYMTVRNVGESPLKGIKEIFKKAMIKPQYFNEYYNWQEHQAKFIVNSIRVYEFFGFEALLPFWNKGNVDFWLTVPAHLRIGRNIYFEAEKHGILIKPLALIPFAGGNGKQLKTSLKSKIIKMLPVSFIEKLLRLTKRKVKLNEGMYQIYSLKADSVQELLDPVKDFPEQTIPYFRNYLHRFPYQINSDFLTALYTIRKRLNSIL